MSQKLRKITIGTLVGIMMLWSFSGILMFPDSPIHRCIAGRNYLYADHPNGYCGKQGQSHTEADFQNYEDFQTITISGLFFFLIAYYIVLSIQRKTRKLPKDDGIS